MNIVTLRRDSYENDGTFGVFIYNDATICVTCELPWNNNEPDISCIPEGEYLVIPHNSIDHPNTWEVTGVTNRIGILIHNGNTENDSEGCILVGEHFGMIAGKDAVMNSDEALISLRKILPPRFMLKVIDGVSQN